MGCRKESYFLEFVYVDVVRDVIGVVFHVLLDGAKDSHNSPVVLVPACWEALILGFDDKTLGFCLEVSCF